MFFQIPKANWNAVPEALHIACHHMVRESLTPSIHLVLNPSTPRGIKDE